MRYQQVGILAVVAAQVAMVTHGLSATPALANEQQELFELCSSFPANSRCEGYEFPISLDDRQGDEVNCLASGDEEATRCKILIGEEMLTVYREFGESISIIDNARDTTETVIPLNTIQSFEYAEDSRVNVGAVVALGLPGLFVRKKTATIDIRHFPVTVETEETTSETATTDPTAELTEESTEVTPAAQQPQQLVLIMQRGQGREMRDRLEEITGLSAEIGL